MLRALWYFIKIAILASIAVWVANRPGSVSVDWLVWRVETTVGIIALGTFLLLVATALTYRLWCSLLRAPRAVAEARRSRRRTASYKALSRGMAAVAAGDHDEASRQARKAGGLLGEPPLTLLLSAQAAQLGGDERAARGYFEAMLQRQETEFLGLRGLIMQAMRGRDDARAIVLARRARKLRPESDWVHDALFQLLSRAGDWRGAQALLESRRGRRGTARRENDCRRAAILVERSRAADSNGKSEEALQQVRKAQELDPELVPAASWHAQLLARSGKAKRALKAIEVAWRNVPHRDLATVYGQVLEGDALARVKAFERLHAMQPDHFESHIALAEAALEAKLWGEARNHLESAATTGTPPRLCRLMARLEEEAAGDANAARAWLDRTAGLDDTWHCADCGALTDQWSAVCGHCGAFGSFNWGPPASAEKKHPALEAPA